MRLSDTVSKFATEIFTDVFDPTISVKGKLRVFSEVANSGPATRRRILETPFGETIPQRRVIETSNGQIFIVADPNYDYWNNEPIRVKYPVLPPDDAFAVGTIGEVLNSTESYPTVYCYPYFVRRVVDEKEMSDYFGGFELYFSKSESFTRGFVVHTGNVYYRLKTDTWVEGAGFSMAEAVKLENPIRFFDIIKNDGGYDPVTDTYTTSTVLGVTCFVEPLRQDYEFYTAEFNSIEVGDKAISLLDTTIKPNDKIGSYKVLSVKDKVSYITCHCRR